MANNQIEMTRAGMQELEEKIEALTTRLHTDISEKIKEARAFGDLSENAEYDEAKNEQARVESEVEQLKTMLRNAVVVEDSDVAADKVSVGSKVKVYDIEFDEEVVFTIVGPVEVDLEQNKISNESPVGAALVGRQAGEQIDVDTPSGVISYKILQINR